MIVSVLAMFDISKAKDKHGKEIEINDEYSTLGMLRYVSIIVFYLRNFRLISLIL